jgi:hypothetical protein
MLVGVRYSMVALGKGVVCWYRVAVHGHGPPTCSVARDEGILDLARRRQSEVPIQSVGISPAGSPMAHHLSTHRGVEEEVR